MTTYDLMRAWLTSGDPTRAAHARWRLTLPDAPLVDDALLARVRCCPHWSPGLSCCSGWSCRRDPDELRTVWLADCAACPDLPPAA